MPLPLNASETAFAPHPHPQYGPTASVIMINMYYTHTSFRLLVWMVYWPAASCSTLSSGSRDCAGATPARTGSSTRCSRLNYRCSSTKSFSAKNSTAAPAAPAAPTAPTPAAAAATVAVPAAPAAVARPALAVAAAALAVAAVPAAEMAAAPEPKLNQLTAPAAAEAAAVAPEAVAVAVAAVAAACTTH